MSTDATVFIQWKGTEVCLDFTCACGADGHFDGEFAYSLKCPHCGAEWAMPCSEEPYFIPLQRRTKSGHDPVVVDVPDGDGAGEIAGA